MNLTLAALSILTATPIVRGRVALSADPSTAARGSALGTLAGLAAVTALVGPVLAAAADVSAPTVRIAAGIVIAVTSIPDLWRRPFVAQPTEPHWRAGVVPVGFPELFGPPLAAALTATATDLGVGAALGLLVVAVAAAGAVIVLPGERQGVRWVRGLAGFRAATAMAVGLALVMNGVYDI